MLVSLKEARRIERRIQTLVDNNEPNVRSAISVYTENDIAGDIADAQEKMDNSVYNIIGLIQARAEIRRDIQIVNEASGINELISRRDTAIKVLNIWKDINKASDSVKPAGVIIRTVKSKQARVDKGLDGIYGNNDVEFTAISRELNEDAIGEIRDAQLVIDNCDDAIAGLNSVTKIEISEDVESGLSENNII